MNIQKENKIRELIRELAAEFFSRESNRTSLITITDVELKSRGATAVIKFTVLPIEKEHDALEFTHRKLTEFREYVKSHSKMMRIPYFEVEIDKGEKNRQRIDTLSE